MKSIAKSRLKTAGTEDTVAATIVAEPKLEAKGPTVEKTDSSSKKVSQRLLETIEKRKRMQANAKGGLGKFQKPPGRRGRRPKVVEYTPEHTEEDGLMMEADYDGIEYDTGITIAKVKDDGGMSMDRFEDFDEELNFDR